METFLFFRWAISFSSRKCIKNAQKNSAAVVPNWALLIAKTPFFSQENGNFSNSLNLKKNHKDFNSSSGTKMTDDRENSVNV